MPTFVSIIDISFVVLFACRASMYCLVCIDSSDSSDSSFIKKKIYSKPIFSYFLQGKKRNAIFGDNHNKNFLRQFWIIWLDLTRIPLVEFSYLRINFFQWQSSETLLWQKGKEKRIELRAVSSTASPALLLLPSFLFFWIAWTLYLHYVKKTTKQNWI